jgi:hypothetical protein
MFNSIFKYKLEIIGEQQNIVVPKGSKILTAQTQCNEIYLWALVPRNSITTESKTIQIYETEGTMSQTPNIEYKYISTVQLFGGSIVYHIFECINKQKAVKE